MKHIIQEEYSRLTVEKIENIGIEISAEDDNTRLLFCLSKEELKDFIGILLHLQSNLNRK